MSWEYEYDYAADETTIRWVGPDGTKTATINGRITEWHKEYPRGEAREAVAEMIQSAGTPSRIRMQFDLVYGFKKRNSQS